MSEFSNFRPVCLNHGCNNVVAHSGERYRPFCHHCHKHNYGAATLKPGVTPFKTGKCSNQDGHLGVECPMNYNVKWVFGLTEIDHIDGNHLNNTPGNCQELCTLCHKYKGMLAGDYKNQNGRYAYKKKRNFSTT